MRTRPAPTAAAPNDSRYKRPRRASTRTGWALMESEAARGSPDTSELHRTAAARVCDSQGPHVRSTRLGAPHPILVSPHTIAPVAATFLPCGTWSPCDATVDAGLVAAVGGTRDHRALLTHAESSSLLTSEEPNLPPHRPPRGSKRVIRARPGARVLTVSAMVLVTSGSDSSPARRSHSEFSVVGRLSQKRRYEGGHLAATSSSSALPIMSDRTTSILVRFTAAPDVTTDQYDETIRRLEKAGDWKPDGL